MRACAHTATRQAFLVKISLVRTSKDLTKNTAPELTMKPDRSDREEYMLPAIVDPNNKDHPARE